MVKIKFLFLTLIFLAASCGGLGGGGKKEPRYPNQADQVMTDAFNKAEALYKNRQFDEAFSAYDQYINTYPYNKLTDESYYKKGKLYFIRGDWDNAIATFQLLSSKSPDSEYVAKGHYMSGYSAYKKPDDAAAQSYFSKVSEGDLPGKFLIHQLSLQIDISNRAQVEKNQIDYYYLRLVDLYHAGGVGGSDAPGLIPQQQAMDRLRSFVVSPIDVDHIPVWFRTYPDGYSRSYVLYKWGKTFYEAGRKEEAKDQLNRFLQGYPKHEYASSAQKLLEQLGGGGPVIAADEGGKEVKVGILLPLTGTQNTYSQAILWGIDCALGKKDGCVAEPYTLDGQPQKILTVIRNSGSTPEEVNTAVDSLVAEEVSVIIGPISGALAEAAAKRAQELKVVILPITQKEGVMALGDWVFQMGYKTQAQMHDLVAEAKARGIRSVGIFYPNIGYGQEMTTQFEEAAKELGLRVLAKASYDPANADLAAQARKLKDSMKRVATTDSSAGFGALFVPDSYRILSRLPEALQFVSISGIPIIGTNAWNDSAAMLAEGYPGSFFRDIFYAGSKDETVAGFVNAYRTSFGKAPTSLEALGFDAIRFVEQAVQNAGSAKSDRIRAILSSATTLRGATRITGFEPGKGPIINSLTLGVGPSGVYQEK